MAIIQARIDSRRLPGKTLADLGGHPLVWYTLRAARAIHGVHQVVLSVPIGQASHFTAVAAQWSVRIQEGPHPDLLAAFMAIAEQEQAEVIVRLTADCWAICPEISQQVIDLFDKRTAQYAANTNPPTTWPEGIDTEVFSLIALLAAYRSARRAEDCEHVTPWMRRHIVCTYLSSPADDYSRHKLSVDTQEDLDRARKLIVRLPSHWTFDDLRMQLETCDGR